MSQHRLRGRIVGVGEDSVVLALGAQQQRLPLAAALSVAVTAGDWVTLAIDHGEVVHCRVETPYTRGVPFPSPGGEFYRFHQDRGALYGRLFRRQGLWRAIRAFFDGRSYLEVETPLRVRHPGLEPHLVIEPAGPDWVLITSPEYQMKRLLAAGFERIYTICKCWRGDEQGAWHLPEFTMIEWYRGWSDTASLMDETEALIRHCLDAMPTFAPKAAGRLLDLRKPFVRLSVSEACRRYGGVDIGGVVDPDELAARLEAAGLAGGGPDEDFATLFSRLMVERVEPALVDFDAVFLHSYPLPLAALAQATAEDRTVADRFELYLGGIELANAFGELRDPVEQERRLLADQAQRVREGAPGFELDERFLEALREGLPPCAGIALGLDRLLMVLEGAESIANCVAFPPSVL